MRHIFFKKSKYFKDFMSEKLKTEEFLYINFYQPETYFEFLRKK